MVNGQCRPVVRRVQISDAAIASRDLRPLYD
jgi:hypothetical protein